mgnify:CR=1 FL=1
MARRSRSTSRLGAEVEGLRRRIDHWRRTRDRHSPMPEDLWDDAVALAGDRGVYPVAHTLGLNYESLKRRVAKASGGRAPEAPLTSFVELRPSLPNALTTPSGAVVELTNESGDRLAIHLPGGSDIDVMALASAFLGRVR